MKIFLAVILTLTSLTIALSLQFMVLKMIGATDVMWLLFWLNVPLGVVLQMFANELKK